MDGVGGNVKESKPVEGISPMHIISVKYDSPKLWHNAVENHSIIPSISTSMQPDFNDPLNEPSEIVENKGLNEIPFEW